MKKSITACPRCQSTALWLRSDGSILCTACMARIDSDGNYTAKEKEINLCTNNTLKESRC